MVTGINSNNGRGVCGNGGTGFCGYNSTYHYAVAHGLRSGSTSPGETSNLTPECVPVHHNGRDLRELVAADARCLYDRVDFKSPDGQRIVPMLTAYLQSQSEISRADFVAVIRGSATSASFKEAVLGA